MAVSPEALLDLWLGAGNAVAAEARRLDPFMVPYDHLADDHGWIVWLGHPPVPDGLPLLPIAAGLRWDEPLTALAAASLVCADYAVRRGAEDTASATAIMRREGPIAIVAPGPVHGALQNEVDRVRAAGIPVVSESPADWDVMLARAPALAARSAAHAALQTRRHDPALSFQTFASVDAIGDNPLSSFVLHHEGERDDLSIVGDVGHRVAIEIGLRGPGVTLQSSAELESLAVTIPSFLDGVTSVAEDDGLVIGWRLGRQPTPQELGDAFRIWLRALTNATVVNVRIAFAPEGGRSDLLAQMRARASAYRRRRQAARDATEPASFRESDE